jgi:hypothetical protein
MTKSEERGLEIAKDLLRQAVATRKPWVRRDDRDDMLAAVVWIARQQAITESRRKPRAKYIGGPR